MDCPFFFGSDSDVFPFISVLWFTEHCLLDFREKKQVMRYTRIIDDKRLLKFLNDVGLHRIKPGAAMNLLREDFKLLRREIFFQQTDKSKDEERYKVYHSQIL